MAISFDPIGSFNGVVGLPSTDFPLLDNPTSLQFGPDGRLYVAQQNQPIVAFTIALQNGQYVATAQETLRLPNGEAVVQSIQNHNDDGTLNFRGDRQTTGLLVTGTAENPILYVTSSDPRLATGVDQDLDTNSSVVTRVTWTGSEWDAVDLVRGLPRSEEAHSINGLALSPDGTKLYVAVGGNTNNGAPSSFFGYLGEYALSGTIVEVDLDDIASRPILADNAPGQNGRKYVYDLPTLDDPTIANVTDGVGEDEFGQDEAGPWGGNDGLNMAILPADAPLRIYADGFRNHYDLVMTADGKLYTVDNGSNADVGGAVTYVDGKATSLPSDGGTGDSEPLFLVEDGGYYGHPNPARANQTLAWTVYDDDGEPDATIFPNSTDGLDGVQGLADLVPEGVDIADGFLIDPSKFTGDAARLAQSGVRVPRNSAASNAIASNLGSSSNGLVQYTGNAFNGALDGKLITAQFNGNVTLLNLNDAGNSLESVTDPNDGTVLSAEGVFPLISAQTLPLDVAVGPNGTLWVAEFGPDNINIFAPSDSPLIFDVDVDDDGLNNIIDPFIRDATNGGSAVLIPGSTLLWDFDPDQDNNLPGPDGYATGLTGVAINGTTDFEAFFQSPSDNPGQLNKLDNVKFATAAGGGSTLIEFVSDGDPLAANNSGEYLFHTGVTIEPTVEAFTITWTAINPAAQMSDASQQIGGYIGTGDQSNYLKVVVTPNAAGEIQVLLEDNDVVQDAFSIQADTLFSVPDPSTKKIFFELEVNPILETAKPTVRYETGNGTEQVTGRSVSLADTAILEAIQGNYTVQTQKSGLAVGLFSTNDSSAAPLSAIFDGIELSATGSSSATAIYRINAGGPTLAAIDGGLDWLSDATTPYLTDPGSNTTVLTPAVTAGPIVPVTTPGDLFHTERYDDRGGSNMQWAFDVASPGMYEVRLFAGNAFIGTSEAGQRIFDVVVEGLMPSQFSNIDLSGQFGHTSGGMLSSTVEVTDGILNLEFLHDAVENPMINGIEILRIEEDPSELPTPIVIPRPPRIHRAPPPPLIESINDPTPTVLYRVNAGGPTVASTDAGPNWLSDVGSTLLIDPGSDTTVLVPQVTPGTTVPTNIPDAIFTTERYDERGGSSMQWAFATPAFGQYEVRLFAGNAYIGASQAGQRLFDVSVEGSIPTEFNNIDLSGQFGHTVGGMISAVVEVTDGILNLEFLHDAVENPMINGIEILQLNNHSSSSNTVVQSVAPVEDNIIGTASVIDFSDELVAPSAPLSLAENATVDSPFLAPSNTAVSTREIDARAVDLPQCHRSLSMSFPAMETISTLGNDGTNVLLIDSPLGF